MVAGLFEALEFLGMAIQPPTAMREQRESFVGLLPESQGRNLVLTV
jgi:hypothetical protein